MKPSGVFVLLFAGSVGYQPDDPRQIRLTLRDGATEVLSLHELRDDSIRVGTDRWVHLDDVATFQDYGRHRPVVGMMLGCCVGACAACASNSEHLFSMSGKEANELTLTVLGVGITTAVIGCAVTSSTVYEFAELTPEERRDVVRKVMGLAPAGTDSLQQNMP